MNQMYNYFPKYVDRTDRDTFHVNMSEFDNKIVIFGDSYAKPHEGSEEDLNKNWYSILSYRTKRQVVLYSQAGTSLLYSKQELFNYLNSELYNENDWIIFITTSFTRIPFVHIEDGWKYHQQSQILSYILKENLRDEDYHIIKKNENTLKWLSRGISQEDFINDMRIMSTFLKSLPNKTLLIPGFYYQGIEKFLDIKDFYLNGVSQYENIHEHILSLNRDMRYNHMSDGNNKVLATKITNYFKNGDTNVFSMEGFKRE